jgi:hypothetical protein
MAQLWNQLVPPVGVEVLCFNGPEEPFPLGVPPPPVGGRGGFTRPLPAAGVVGVARVMVGFEIDGVDREIEPPLLPPPPPPRASATAAVATRKMHDKPMTLFMGSSTKRNALSTLLLYYTTY